MPKFYLGDEIHSSQRTTLILIYYTFFLTVNEILKGNKQTQTKNPKPDEKKSKCHSIHKTHTILFKLFLCALCKLSFQHTTFYFHQMLHLGTLRHSYTKSVISLNFIILIILIYHSSKPWFFHWNCEISVFVQYQNRLFHNTFSKRHTLYFKEMEVQLLSIIQNKNVVLNRISQCRF